MYAVPVTPEDVRTRDVTSFVVPAIGDRKRILEVGCGRGRVARELAIRGYDVTALDVELRDCVDAPGVKFVEADFLTYDDAPFDAVVFTSSLHHIAPLDRAIERLAKLTAHGARLVVDEFDLDAPDNPTLRWYYDLLAEDIDGDLVDYWHHEHHHDVPLHTGTQMRNAISQWFAVNSQERGPYLYRYVASKLPDDEPSGRRAADLRAEEERRIGTGAMRAVGLRFVATRRDIPVFK
jgi:SAM-dependent methyltransferase